jgi:hypothetical protein
MPPLDRDAEIPALSGACRCGAVAFIWFPIVAVDDTVAGACQCAYCIEKDAVYLAQHGSRLRLRLGGPVRRARQGTGTADFIECESCDDLVAVLSDIQGRTYAVVNARMLPHETIAHMAVADMDFSDEMPTERLLRRQRTWIDQVRVIEEPSSMGRDEGSAG